MTSETVESDCREFPAATYELRGSGAPWWAEADLNCRPQHFQGARTTLETPPQARFTAIRRRLTPPDDSMYVPESVPGIQCRPFADTVNPSRE